MIHDFTKNIAYNRPVPEHRIGDQDTLIWNPDGFCWLRGKNGEPLDFEGKFSSLPVAEAEARLKGFNPLAVYHVPFPFKLLKTELKK